MPTYEHRPYDERAAVELAAEQDDHLADVAELDSLGSPSRATPADLLAMLPNWRRRNPDDRWADAYGRDVPPLLDELAAARGALTAALGSEGAVPLGGLAAGIRKLAEQLETVTGHMDRVARLSPTIVQQTETPDGPGAAPRRWDSDGWPAGSVGC